MSLSNLEIAKLLRKMSAAYEILGENRFKIIAYDRAADSVEHLTQEAKDLWDDGKLDEIPGVGKSMMFYLDELFNTGKIKHFDQTLAKLPHTIYPLLDVPGIGPKKAYKLVEELKLQNVKTVMGDLESAALNHKIATIEGFGQKSELDILEAIKAYQKGAIKQNRMVLPEADRIATEVSEYLKKLPSVKRVDTLGSLRRKVSTIGDIDLSVLTDKSEEVIDHFVKFPHQKLIERGPTGASLLLHNGRQIDMRVQTKEAYGAMLQYFTGSKNHNIKLRSYALEHGLSLSEWGIKHVKTGKIEKIADEETFYKKVGLPYIEPEIREDRGEIEAALRQAQSETIRQAQKKVDKKGILPVLVNTADMRGDLHLHTSYNLEPSHDLGVDPLDKILNKAENLKYSYIGISDHNPSVGNHSQSQIISIMRARKRTYEQIYDTYTKNTHNQVKLFVMMEVDIQVDGSLALPELAFEFVDAVIVSVHSSFRLDRKTMTQRIIKALTGHPKVRILGHPTGRLLGKREGYEVNWGEIFEVCKDRNIALEINAAPERLDLPDSNVYDAVKTGVRCIIDTDSHAADQMGLMKYGVSVARRGWATKHDIVNTMEYNEFYKWLLNY